eukprot:TRINITY_DN525_c0_g1_i1.p2 TRINITY_DN525_c0_g1~~TRINITY_DN525_c0_g1_i1.p2  ORF type:complete len:311 (-),score=46.45 TRINITY_DN525_c0_g1_i1:1206-2138(-)
MSRIEYTAVLFEKIPLAEWQSSLGTFRPFLLQFLKSTDPHLLPRTTYLIGSEYRMFILPRWGCVAFVCIAQASFSESQAFSFLMEFFIQFKSEFRSRVQSYKRGEAVAVRYELNSSLQPFLSHTLHRHNTTKLEDYDLVVFSLDDAEEQLEEGQGSHSPLSHPSQHHSSSLSSSSSSSAPTRTLHLRSKMPLLSQHAPVQSSRPWKSQKNNRAESSMNPLSAWLLRHPYLTIGFCIFVGVGLLLYFLVIVPLCGPRLEKRVDNNPQSAYVCWFSTSNSSDFSPPVPSNQTLTIPIAATPNATEPATTTTY